MSSCFKCCGKDPEVPEKSDPLKSKRICKDLLCCIIFAAFVAFLMTIMGLCFAAGDWQALVYDADYLGNRCGTGGRGQRAFYPRVARDMAEQRDIVLQGRYWDLRLYALCVDSCPTDFNIQSPTVVQDYGYNPSSSVTQALGSGTQSEWISATPTYDLFNRCVPRIDTDSDTVRMCAYPNCTAPEAVSLGAQCTALPNFGLSWEIMNRAQQSLCLVEARETRTMQYQLASEDDASQAALASIAEVVGGFFEVVSAFQDGMAMIIVFGILAPIFCSIIYMILLYLFTKTIIYGLLVLLVLVELVATLVAFARSGIEIAGVSGSDIVESVSSSTNATLNDDLGAAIAEVEDGSNWIYTVAFWLLLIITTITVITIILWRKKIAICAAIVREATTVFKDISTLLVFPIFTSFCQVLVCAWFFVSFTMLQTTRAESFDLALGRVPNETYAVSLGAELALPSVDPISGLRTMSESGNLRMFFAVSLLYGFFVLYQWVGGMAWTSMSAATGWWYYFKGNEEHKVRFPLLRALVLMLTFHSGSVAFAAFIIAIFDLLRTAVAYIERQMAAQGASNTLTRLAFCCLGCCINCIQRTVKMISYYGMVFVATNGNSFCWACASTARFFIKHAGQVAVNQIVIWLIWFISALTTPISCAIVSFYALDAMGNDLPMYPAIAVFFFALLMTTACMGVFDCTITTIFVCAFEDQEKYESRYMLQPHHKSLAAVFNKKPAKKVEEDKSPEDEKLVTA